MAILKKLKLRQLFFGGGGSESTPCFCSNLETSDGYGDPAAIYGDPAAIYGAPTSSGYGAQAPSYDDPAPSYGAPAASYGAPAASYGAPGALSYSAPAVPSYGAPSNSYNVPSSGYSARRRKRELPREMRELYSHLMENSRTVDVNSDKFHLNDPALLHAEAAAIHDSAKLLI